MLWDVLTADKWFLHPEECLISCAETFGLNSSGMESFKIVTDMGRWGGTRWYLTQPKGSSA
ncbi:hypothetical protein FRX31_014572 [Thalictrum thalictroides]|uniref:Uncharacterized protein n=1 Tax=Thalictrum thalictroides TaxID=46969 RepID=A0A7J6WG35_THATH|nr:hypothetical protein FRX31_014572 [Thalictrum thalictroides]